MCRGSEGVQGGVVVPSASKKKRRNGNGRSLTFLWNTGPGRNPEFDVERRNRSSSFAGHLDTLGKPFSDLLKVEGMGSRTGNRRTGRTQNIACRSLARSAIVSHGLTDPVAGPSTNSLTNGLFASHHLRVPVWCRSTPAFMIATASSDWSDRSSVAAIPST
jgi:hypothetical protein